MADAETALARKLKAQGASLVVTETELARWAELAQTDLEAFYREVEEWRRESGYA